MRDSWRDYMQLFWQTLYWDLSPILSLQGFKCFIGALIARLASTRAANSLRDSTTILYGIYLTVAHLRWHQQTQGFHKVEEKSKVMLQFRWFSLTLLTSDWVVREWTVHKESNHVDRFRVRYCENSKFIKQESLLPLVTDLFERVLDLSSRDQNSKLRNRGCLHF